MCLRYLPDLVSGLAIYLVAKAKKKPIKTRSHSLVIKIETTAAAIVTTVAASRATRTIVVAISLKTETKVKTKIAMVSRMIIANRAASSSETSVKIKMISAITKVVSLVRHSNHAMSNKSLSTRSKMASSKKTKRRRSVKLLNAENVVTSAAASV